MTDPTTRVRRVHDLFRQVLGLPEADRRDWLERLARDDPNAIRVAAMLDALRDRADSTFLDPDALRRGPLWSAITAAAGDDEPAVESPPERAGHYRILQEIGRGGMAVVYLAERDDGEYDQRVALKIMHRGLMDDAAARRFRQERQILASLQHPNIARLLDGGVTEDGRPYLVMGYVDGRPIHDYATARDLSVAGRLDLVLTICDAVAHAHRRLIVHRDLKPSNILVSREGVVQLLDFGIAKLLEPEASGDDPSDTRTDMRLLTPSYASPEQIVGGPIGTASDVYQLGLLLYELLADRRPYSVEGLTPGGLERVVCEADAAPPSAVVPGGPRRRALRGDLDAIVLKAMAKKAEDRYESGSALADDLRRYIDGQPVRAQRPTWSYLAVKLARRHRVPLIAGVTVLAALLLGLVGTGWQAHRAAVERDRAQLEAQKKGRVADVLADLFLSVDPRGDLHREGTEISLGDLLDRARNELTDKLADAPEVEADIRMEIGTTYRNLHRFDDSEEQLRQALRLQRAARGDDHPNTLETMSQLVETLIEKGNDAGEATALVKELRRRTSRALGDDQVLSSRARYLEGYLLYEEGALEAAEETARAAFNGLQRVAGETDEQALVASDLLAMVLGARGDDEGAADLQRQTLARRRLVNGNEHYDTTIAMSNLAVSLVKMGTDLDEAEALYREAIAVQEKLLGEDSDVLARTCSNFGLLLRDLGRLDEAEAMLVRALRIRERQLGVDHRDTLVTRHNLALVLRTEGDFERAARYADAVVKSALKAYPEGHYATALFRLNLGACLRNLGRFEEAEVQLQASYRELTAALGEDHEYVATAARYLAKLYEDWNKPDLAAEFAARIETP